MLVANFVFQGTPSKGPAEAGLAGVLPKDRSLQLKVTKVLWAAGRLAAFEGREVGVSFEDAKQAAAAGAAKEVTVFGEVRGVGRSLALFAVGYRTDLAPAAAAKEVAALEEKSADEELSTRLAAADLVVQATIKGVAHAEEPKGKGGKPDPLEHEAHFDVATLEVAAVVDKAGKSAKPASAQSVKLLLPRGGDGAWAGQPVLAAGEAGFWFLHKAGEKGEAYLALDPLDHRAQLRLSSSQLFATK
jgi:hypothetical protein